MGPAVRSASFVSSAFSLADVSRFITHEFIRRKILPASAAALSEIDSTILFTGEGAKASEYWGKIRNPE